jgi:L-lactate dehydrogenase (cytochrome)
VRPAEIRQLIGFRAPQMRRARRAVARCVTIQDLQRVARRWWPRAVRDYVDGGADGEVSVSRNRQAYESFDFVPIALRDVGAVDSGTDFLGRRTLLPFLLGPTGMTRMMHPDGEVAAARAAQEAGIAYTVSTLSTVSLEDVAREHNTDLWFQLYVWRDRELSRQLLGRAHAAGYRVLVITVDTAVSGLRVRDRHNGFSLPPHLTPRTLAEMTWHPGWCWGLLRGAPISFANFDHTLTSTGQTVMDFVARQFDPAVTWSDIEELRSLWHGPMLLKGMFGPVEACRAAEIGIDGLVLSNHGGRQLDQVVPPVVALPDVRAAVGETLQLFVDSGIRRGSDIVAALASGADGCLIGRSYLYGLGAAGQAGCSSAISILASELRRTMQLLGVRTIAEIRECGPKIVRSKAGCRG